MNKLNIEMDSELKVKAEEIINNFQFRRCCCYIFITSCIE